jgi:BON domain-containing protein
MMKSDSELERDVKEELRWHPDLDATDIAVSAHSGAVTLTGFVRGYTDKYEAESAAKRVAGVIAVANDIEVRMPSIHQRPDPDIARDAAAAIKNYLPISYEQIKAVVRDGLRAKSSGSTSSRQRKLQSAHCKGSKASAI